MPNNFSMPGGNASGDGESDRAAASQLLLAQLRRQQSSTSPNPAAGPNGSNQYGQLAYHGHHGHGHVHNIPQGGQPYYGPDSPGLNASFQNPLDSAAFLPEAPTPPIHAFNHSQFPYGLMQPIGAGRGVPPAGAGENRTAQLLNLLKLGQGSSSNQNQPQFSQEAQPSYNTPPPMIHAPAPSGSDPSGFLAALMRGAHPEQPKPEAAPASSSSWNQPAPPSNTQQYLLNLLSKPKPSQNDTSEIVESSFLTPPPAEDDSKEARKPADMTLPETVPSRSQFDFEPQGLESTPPKFSSTPQSQHSQPASAARSGIFSSQHDDQLASSPSQRTPKSSAGSAMDPNVSRPPAASAMQILRKPDPNDPKRPLSDHSSTGSPDHTRRKLEHVSSPHGFTTGAPRVAPNIITVSPGSEAKVELGQDHVEGERKKESVAEAVVGLAEQADREAQEALARAEGQSAQAEITQDLEQMMSAETDDEFARSAQVAAQAIQKQLEKDENKDVLESALDAEVAKEVRSIVDKAAQAGQGPVADSWESAEADEIVAIEETAAPIKVYNFPLKPWITISVQETDEVRPVFREEAILDIARLKKDFDQIDRNLVSASESYMAYGMSKAGGLRVIRQEDGKDAKLFTDTKDRIFNVAISSSASNQHPKEAIIGTGVSGTVYWVQLKNGDRDHLEDAHPEQYGFALPPLSSQEGGDAPGGVLKTRARPSSMHPDYFAVGRGKSINIIWPSFIFENNLFKNAHDRVVDTERLFQQCSLKINTGKAGKDFTFSQDDTLMVTLDKSGRVKFWDVRDLTAVREGSDPLNPMPAHTSLEIKDPLMTLTTTPEGEKAWPTSVLLLDKYRPYQKRAALRYMIVGMKQNHTLQLWDLALGKAVQEFNFPHNKESDAVCSVMYHARSSMIVVGHPTRNSIYFLHLSAPKYGLKNLSQVDYIQRLVAQDPSIPQPEATAVISGIREYSFANKGVLRSLGILGNPAGSTDGDEANLFELYAMHSKGVTCVFIKNGELGWSKDNKVICPADAEKVGLVKISKLVAPVQPVEVQQALTPAETSAPPQIRIATRPNKEILQKTPSSQGDDKKGIDSVSTVKPDRKEDIETPVQNNNQPERAEKKGRKKKAAAAAAAAAAAGGDSAVNGQAEQQAIPTIGRTSSQVKARSARNADSSALNLPSQFSDLSLNGSGISQEQLNTVIADLESRISNNMNSMPGRMSGVFESSCNDMFKRQREQLHGWLQDWMRNFMDSRDDLFLKNQSAVLQVVSDVLNDNTETVLKSLVVDQVNNAIIPAIRSTVEKVAKDQVDSSLNKQLPAMQKEIEKRLPSLLTQSLQKADITPSLVDKLADQVLQKVATRLDVNIANQLTKSFSEQLPVLSKRVAEDVHQRIAGDISTRMGESIARFEERKRDDDAKLDRLIAQNTELSTALAALAASQVQMQKEFGALKQQLHEQNRDRDFSVPEPTHSHTHSRASGSVSSHQQAGGPSRDLVTYAPSQAHQHQHTPSIHSMAQHQQQQFVNQEQQALFSPTPRENREKMELNNTLETIDRLMSAGQYDQAVMRWLQAEDKSEEVFQQVISKYDPRCLSGLAPIFLLSVGASIVSNLSRRSPKIQTKIAMVETIVYAMAQALPHLEDQVVEAVPKVMSLIQAKMEELLLAISRESPHDASLKTLSNIAHLAGRVGESCQPSRQSLGHPGAPY
ncbi:hypothetical protein NEUTE1DRAFT_65709 [Neurospora tetrasperma FGSC 2508]|uniref:EDC4-like protein pdc1 beta-propeller domain-containing protein n=1 Tax=Neurospora tetrasperma (strain FGSC 2508 / ATCC MYA-4615 / P0657) TaxID=510951 RepID=F8MR65_NEUT8|nr:uncharacterized protein NEUTE1DRAFT_65709 [Neurospora tetrasperma FGSC 2508]EGO56845.1 hypothetical protein NEUTE1DRAFT_65709 [Neurospora tetrasperma FGSC 2508]EGZ70268.1 hypothetical protein NEUTE2DRAFT_67840 [Neurospora tetrasperma FGSC 2509]